MKRILVAGFAGLALASLAASSLHGQRRISFNVAAGVSLPQGDLADRVDAGWHALATVDLTSPMQVYGLRFDAAYNRFAQDETTTSATFNLTYRLPMTDSPFSPYFITGLGAYRSECAGGPECDAELHYGWNLGLGTKIYALGVRSFLEARYHRTGHRDRDVHYFPLTLGITF